MTVTVQQNDAVDTIDVPLNKTDYNTPVNTQNVMQMYKQNPVGMFMGAQLSNCTININMPK